MYRIAIASSSGEAVDQHFGQATGFLIYEVSTEGVEFLEDRPVVKASNEQMHAAGNLESIVGQLKDCSAVFVLKIGLRSKQYLNEHGINSFEVDFPLYKIFKVLVENEKKGRIRIL